MCVWGGGLWGSTSIKKNVIVLRIDEKVGNNWYKL